MSRRRGDRMGDPRYRGEGGSTPEREAPPGGLCESDEAMISEIVYRLGSSVDPASKLSDEPYFRRCICAFLVGLIIGVSGSDYTSLFNL